MGRGRYVGDGLWGKRREESGLDGRGRKRKRRRKRRWGGCR
jgi:hypothetical protein